MTYFLLIDIFYCIENSTFFLKIALEIFVCKMHAILFRPQFVKFVLLSDNETTKFSACGNYPRHLSPSERTTLMSHKAEYGKWAGRRLRCVDLSTTHRISWVVLRSHGSNMNPGAQTYQITLQRNDTQESWGFRLQGGTDFAQPLSVGMVSLWSFVLCY